MWLNIIKSLFFFQWEWVSYLDVSPRNWKLTYLLHLTCTHATNVTHMIAVSSWTILCHCHMATHWQQKVTCFDLGHITLTLFTRPTTNVVRREVNGTSSKKLWHFALGCVCGDVTNFDVIMTTKVIINISYMIWTAPNSQGVISVLPSTDQYAYTEGVGVGIVTFPLTKVLIFFRFWLAASQQFRPHA